LSDSEAIEDLYHKHIGTSLDFDGVIEREETLQKLWARRVYGKGIDLKAYTEEEKPVMELYLAQQREEGCMKDRFFTESRWDWNQSGTRMGDFYDYIKRNILSDEQPQSPFVLHDMFSQNQAPKLGFDISQAGDKSEPTSVTGVSNVTVSQDSEQDTLRQNCLSVSQNQAAKLPVDISQAGG